MIACKQINIGFRALLVAVGLMGPFAATAQEACTTYTVQEGDTLANIAQTAYGTYDYQMIFNANRDALAASPNALAAGLTLILPCEDGRLTAESEFNEVIAEQEEKQAANRRTDSEYAPPIKFVSGNGWKPFTDESLTGGGILVRLATTAMQRGGNDRESKLAWVDDWDSHVTTLLPSRAFDFSIAWSMPDCTKIDLLGAEGVQRCTEYAATLPVYEVAHVLWTLADSELALATSYEDFFGKRVCKPQGWSVFPLEEVGLIEPTAILVQPDTVLACGEMLLAGEVDVFAIEMETANEVFTQLDALDKVTSNPTLVRFLSFHFVTSQANPRAAEYIEMVNNGLTEMRESGEWYDIVSTGLAEYNAASQ